MLELKFLICNGVKDDSTIIILVKKLKTPHCGTILPYIMHTN